MEAQLSKNEEKHGNTEAGSAALVGMSLGASNAASTTAPAASTAVLKESDIKVLCEEFEIERAEAEQALHHCGGSLAQAIAHLLQ